MAHLYNLRNSADYCTQRIVINKTRPTKSITIGMRKTPAPERDAIGTRDVIGVIGTGIIVLGTFQCLSQSAPFQCLSQSALFNACPNLPSICSSTCLGPDLPGPICPPVPTCPICRLRSVP